MRRAIALSAVAAGFALPGVASAATPMTIAQAHRYVIRTLRHEYGGEFSRRTLSRACARVDGGMVRCQVGWSRYPFAYAGPVTLWYSESDAAADYASYSYRSLIDRMNIREREPNPSRRSGP